MTIFSFLKEESISDPNACLFFELLSFIVFSLHESCHQSFRFSSCQVDFKARGRLKWSSSSGAGFAMCQDSQIDDYIYLSYFQLTYLFLRASFAFAKALKQMLT